MHEIYASAQDHQIPVILHFQHDAFNTAIERFYKVVEKYPRAKFLGRNAFPWAAH